MKVLVITASLDERSGWGRYSRAVIDQLVAHGVSVSACSEGARVMQYHTVVLHGLSSWFGLAFIMNMVRVRVAAADADVVHAFDGWPYAIYGWAGVVGTRKKLFTSGIATYSVPQGHFLKRLLFHIVYERAAKILSVSEYTRERMIARGVVPEKIIVIHMGVTRLPSLDGGEVDGLAKKFRIDPGAYPIVLTVGQIKDRKGQFDTLRAVELLRATYPKILYVMAGSPDISYVERIQQFIKEKKMDDTVRLIQGADDSALSFLYSRCDIVALNANTDDTSLHFEGFGLSILEGYQFGKPGIGSRGSGVQEAIQHGVTGALSRQRDSEDIAEKIQWVLAEYAMFSRGAAKAYESFNWKRTVEAYIKEYNH